MLWLKATFATFCLGTLLSAQTLPAGTALPMELGSSLNAKGSKPGQTIQGKLMQEVRLPSGVVIRSGSRVTGHVVSVNRPGANGPRIVVQFDKLQNEKATIPLNVALRALADSADVFNAGLPVGPSSSGEFSGQWVTKQVGGEYVFRGRGYVSSDKGKVGIYSGTGVWGKLGEGDNCPNSGTSDELQALWIFSTTACGVYGLPDMKLAQDGSTPPMGQIALQSTKDIVLRGGSGWLLVVNAQPAKDTTK